MNINFKYICDNNIILSLLIACICTLVLYLDNKYNGIKKPLTAYVRVIVLIVLAINGVFYLKNKNLKDVKCNYSNVKIGEPDF